MADRETLEDALLYFLSDEPFVDFGEWFETGLKQAKRALESSTSKQSLLVEDLLDLIAKARDFEARESARWQARMTEQQGDRSEVSHISGRIAEHNAAAAALSRVLREAEQYVNSAYKLEESHS